jgi:hypothetical protein
MRIIPDDAELLSLDGMIRTIDCYDIVDTIEITDDEWDEIYEAYDYPEMWDTRLERTYTFAQYLRQLISLKVSQ